MTADREMKQKMFLGISRSRLSVPGVSKPRKFDMEYIYIFFGGGGGGREGTF